MTDLKNDMNDNKVQKPKGKISSWLYLGLALIYTFSPVDLMPDTIPILGWIDDIALLLSATLNLAQKNLVQGNELVENILKYAKYIVLGIAVVIILLFLLLGAAIINLFS